MFCIQEIVMKASEVAENRKERLSMTGLCVRKLSAVFHSCLFTTEGFHLMLDVMTDELGSKPDSVDLPYRIAVLFFSPFRGGGGGGGGEFVYPSIQCSFLKHNTQNTVIVINEYRLHTSLHVHSGINK